MPAPGSGAAHAHAARCPICAGRIEEARALDAFLAFAAPPPAPLRFSDQVMARIAAEGPSPAAHRAAVLPTHRLARWLGILTDPAFTVSIAMASALLGLSKTALVVARAFPAIPGAAALTSLHLSAPRVELPLSPLGQWALLLSVAPFIVWGSLLLARWTEHAVPRRIHRG
jgi:hypothetical protein